MRAKIFFAIIMLVCICCGFQVFAQATKTWVGVNTNWNSSSNWSPAGIPSPGDNIILSTDGLSDCIIPDNVIINNLTITSDYMFILYLPSGNLFITGNINIDGFFNWEHSNGTVILNGVSPQTISITPPENFPFWNLTLDNSSGITKTTEVVIENDITGTFGCTSPQTGGIYHIANDFAL